MRAERLSLMDNDWLDRFTICIERHAQEHPDLAPFFDGVLALISRHDAVLRDWSKDAVVNVLRAFIRNGHNQATSQIVLDACEVNDAMVANTEKLRQATEQHARRLEVFNELVELVGRVGIRLLIGALTRGV